MTRLRRLWCRLAGHRWERVACGTLMVGHSLSCGWWDHRFEGLCLIHETGVCDCDQAKPLVTYAVRCARCGDGGPEVGG